MSMLSGAAYAVDVSTHCFANCGFPDTGLKVHYSTTSGDDSDYRSSATQPRYTIYNLVGVSSVTVDNRTGLMWITDPAMDAGFKRSGMTTWEVAISSCEALNYAGYSDWRLPNVRELVSIVDYGASAAPLLNAAAFPNSDNTGFWWSSTTYTPNSAKAWAVTAEGYVWGETKTNDWCWVRCVRGGP